MSSPRVGLAIAVAIACHNIPEGVVLGIGVLASTGSRARALLWATLAGLSEPLGALIAWAIISGAGGGHPAVVGALLALAAGIMAFIALLELLPSALKFGSYLRTAVAVFVGMAVIATSLVLLALFSG
jgi:zinc transporter, ZIP family